MENLQSPQEPVSTEYSYSDRLPRFNLFMNNYFNRFWNKPLLVKFRKRFKIWSLEDGLAETLAQEVRYELDNDFLDRIKQMAKEIRSK